MSFLIPPPPKSLKSGIQPIMLVQPMLGQRYRQYIHYTIMWIPAIFGIWVIIWGDKKAGLIAKVQAR